MGTLFNQLLRRLCHVTFDDVERTADKLREIANTKKMALADIIEIWKNLIIDRQNNLAVEDGDTKDEQLAGLGEILNRISDGIQLLVQCYENKEVHEATPKYKRINMVKWEASQPEIDDVLYSLAQIKKPWISADTVASTWNKIHNTNHCNASVGRMISNCIATGKITVLTPKRRNAGNGYIFDAAKWEARKEGNQTN